jgi:hypothetical protein
LALQALLRIKMDEILLLEGAFLEESVLQDGEDKFRSKW